MAHVTVAHGDVEMIAHEFEHIIEQLDEVDLIQKARRSRSGVRATDGVRSLFETHIEPLLLHFSVRRFLFEKDRYHHITDLAKGDARQTSWRRQMWLRTLVWAAEGGDQSNYHRRIYLGVKLGVGPMCGVDFPHNWTRRHT